jgi:hypothetical protein
MTSGKAKLNPFTKLALESAKTSAPAYFTPCPFQGLYTAQNITLVRQFITFFPNGNFRIRIIFTDGLKSNVELFKTSVDFTMS